MSEREPVLFSYFKDKPATRRQPEPPGPVRVLIVDDEEPVRKFVDRVTPGAADSQPHGAQV